MKRFKILMATAIVFATASAFTTQGVDMEDIYVKTGPTTYQLLEEVQDQGACVTEPNSSCEHILNSNKQFEPIDTDRAWQEL